MILVQKMPLFYGETFVTFGYQLMLTLFVQLMGMGFAGYLRRFSVYPIRAIWPTVVPTIAMNRALTRPVCRPLIRTEKKYSPNMSSCQQCADFLAGAKGEYLRMDDFKIQILLHYRYFYVLLLLAARLSLHGFINLQLDDLDRSRELYLGHDHWFIDGSGPIKSYYHL
jgi:hypothetical protein